MKTEPAFCGVSGRPWDTLLATLADRSLNPRFGSALTSPRQARFGRCGCAVRSGCPRVSRLIGSACRPPVRLEPDDRAGPSRWWPLDAGRRFKCETAEPDDVGVGRSPAVCAHTIQTAARAVEARTLGRSNRPRRRGRARPERFQMDAIADTVFSVPHAPSDRPLCRLACGHPEDTPP